MDKLASLPRVRHHGFPGRLVVRVADVVAVCGSPPGLPRLVQECVDPAIVRRYLRAPGPPVRVVDGPRGPVLVDGYHRLCASLLRG